MKPIDLYNRIPESETNDINMVKGSAYNHIPEIDEYVWFDEKTIAKNDKIKIYILKYFDFDGRRFWRLATVWFEGKPVMIIRNAGREGDDHRSRFVTNETLYKQMVEFIKTLMPVEF